LRDPMSERLLRIAREAGPVAERLAPALIAVRDIFGDDLPSDPRFTGPVQKALDQLFATGAKRTAAEISAAA
jgi:fructuronate reductase